MRAIAVSLVFGLLVGLAVLGAIRARMPVAAATGDSPALQASPGTYDFGKIGQGESVRAQFTLTNVADVPFKIVAIHAPCQCTATHSDQNRLSPGESTLLTVVFEAGAARGHVDRIIQLQYISDGAKTMQVAQVLISGEVEPDYHASETRLVFESNQDGKRTITVWRGPNKPHVAIESAYCSDAAFEATVRDPPIPSEASRIDLSFHSAEWDPEKQEAELILLTNSPHQPQMQIPLEVPRRKESRVFKQSSSSVTSRSRAP
ncbi:MAG TPA: DUF1573 domain-containing protein [Pirellulales bacterium]|jgi:hypothetical protein|nr:DUF1573 domain-containing protein [Pirellulales bacterium]